MLSLAGGRGRMRGGARETEFARSLRSRAWRGKGAEVGQMARPLQSRARALAIARLAPPAPFAVGSLARGVLLSPVSSWWLDRARLSGSAFSFRHPALCLAICGGWLRGAWGVSPPHGGAPRPLGSPPARPRY